MKEAFSLIFTVYMFFLSVQTCSDLEIISCEGGHEAVISGEVSSSEDHAHEDTCSPICYCICCNSPITIDLKPITLSCITKSDLSLPGEIQKTNNLNKPFWQPPEVI
jgi:hypothetical protein